MTDNGYKMLEFAENINLGAMISKRAEINPDLPAITFKEETSTYRQFIVRVYHLAEILKQGGINKGDRVAYLGTNHTVFLETLIAASCLGAIFLPINFRLAGPELEFIINDANVHTLIADQERSGLIDSIRGDLQCTRFIGLKAFSALWEDLEALLMTSDSLQHCVQTEPDDVAIIMYTSGTTGRPKGAMLTHANLFWNNMNVFLATDTIIRKVSLTCAPLFHVGGLNVTTLPTLLKGGHLILQDVFDPERVLADIETYQVQSMWGAPAMFMFMAEHPNFPASDLSSIDFMVCGGAPVQASLIKKYKGKGLKLCQGYGLTETAAFASLLGSDIIEEKLGSAGKPPAFGEIHIVGQKNEPLAHGERGEVCIRGPMVFRGYWQRPDATKAAIEDSGWFHTGDVGYLDEEGYLFLCDRVKDIVISGGENIYPAEVESVIYEHSAIAEVAVIGLPDGKWGEAVTAVIVLRPDQELTLEQLREFMDRKIARYKLPLRLHYVDELPRNPAGKILKYKLRDHLTL